MAGRNERQRRQARERYRRQQQERAARQRQVRKRWVTGVSAVVAAGLIAALIVVFLPGSGKNASASASKSPKATATASASASASASTVAEPAHHCSYSAATSAAKKVSFPPAAPDYTASYQATINTNQGKIVFNLLNSKATCTVNSFVHLAEAGYFNKTQCHRLLTSGIFVLQCGDPYATSTAKLTCSSSSIVGTGTPGYAFASENLTGAKYPAGTVAMANEGTATSNGSQFFIVYKDSTSGLTASYTPFATVSSGLDIVQNVAKDGYSCQYAQAGGGAPKKKVIIDSVTIKKT
ncbi:MAG TPA: peptidylprolyl isomerase [Streptosporangiaceae bacterium]|nr:peptidylprolyl isomerase [Streptosporangiaceae bacterium]